MGVYSVLAAWRCGLLDGVVIVCCSAAELCFLRFNTGRQFMSHHAVEWWKSIVRNFQIYTIIIVFWIEFTRHKAIIPTEDNWTQQTLVKTPCADVPPSLFRPVASERYSTACRVRLEKESYLIHWVMWGGACSLRTPASLSLYPPYCHRFRGHLATEAIYNLWWLERTGMSIHS